MPFGNRIKESSASTSTSSIALSGAQSGGWLPFTSTHAVGATSIKVMFGPDSAGAWLMGEYTLSSSSVLTRTAILASSANGADVTLASGTKDVFNTPDGASLHRALAASSFKATTDDALSIGSLVYIKSTGNCGLADYTAEGKEALAFAVAACSSGQTASLSLAGTVISGLSSLTPGAFYYMGTAGAIVTLANAPTTTGNVLMKVGTAISATQLMFAPEAPVTL
jgi:hypothetical protein